MTSFLFLEDGDDLLLEDGISKLVAEDHVAGATFERSAAIAATASIASSGAEFGGPTTFSRSASLRAFAQITVAAEEDEPAPAPPLPRPSYVEPEVLTVSLDVLGGQELRFGPDRDDEADVPIEIDWATQNPGGFADGSVVLARPPWISAADAPLLANLEVTGRGGVVKYRGRVKGVPQVDVNTIRIEAEGLAAALSDNEYFRLLGVHNDLSEWRGPSVTTKASYDGAGLTIQENLATDPDRDDVPALATRLTDSWPSPVVCDGWLDTGGMAIGLINYTWVASEDINIDDPNYGWWVYLFESDSDLSDFDDSINLRPLGAGGDGGLTATGTRKFARVHVLYSIALPNDPVTGSPPEIGLSTIWWPALSVFGTHGLTPYAIDDPDLRYGLRDSEVIEYAVRNGAPSVPVSSAMIETSDFVIPHVVHTGTVSELIESVSVYGSTGGRLNDWGVYEHFFHRPPGWGRTWRVRRDEVEFSESGPVSDNRCSGMVVTYNDGVTDRSVGPPGSGADFVTASLQDTSPLNPTTRLPDGRVRVVSGGITSRQGAINIGIVAMAEANADTRRGSVTMTGTVTDEANNVAYASDVRSCDQVVVVDEEVSGPPEVQPIVGTNHSDNGLTVSCDLGLPPPSVEALLARLEARTIQG